MRTAIHLAAAAFGRLCVETDHLILLILWAVAAAFGRLCVETDDPQLSD